MSIRNTEVVDLSPLAACTAMEDMELCFTKVADLGPLATCTNLRRLDIRFTQVADLAPLASCSAISRLFISKPLSTRSAGLNELPSRTQSSWMTTTKGSPRFLW
jgi:Leucine-rich repeat (LRR) protein